MKDTQIIALYLLIQYISSSGDTIIDFGNWGFFDVLESKEWTLYTPIQYINKKELKNPYKNFYVIPFDQPTDKAV